MESWELPSWKLAHEVGSTIMKAGAAFCRVSCKGFVDQNGLGRVLLQAEAHDVPEQQAGLSYSLLSVRDVSRLCDCCCPRTPVCNTGMPFDSVTTGALPCFMSSLPAMTLLPGSSLLMGPDPSAIRKGGPSAPKVENTAVVDNSEQNDPVVCCFLHTPLLAQSTTSSWQAAL